MNLLQQKNFFKIILCLSILLISLIFIGCRSKGGHSPIALHPPVPDKSVAAEKIPHYLANVFKDPQRSRNLFVTYEVSPTENSYKRGLFLPGFAFSDKNKTYVFQVDSAITPNSRNCKCEGANEHCLSDGLETFATLRPKNGGEDLLADMKPAGGSDLFSLKYLSSQISAAGHYVSISICYERISCSMAHTVTCRNRLYSTQGDLHEVSLEPFATLPAMRRTKKGEDPIGAEGLLEYRAAMLPQDYPFYKQLQTALLEKKTLRLAEVIFEGNRLVRRWILDGYPLYDRFRDRTVRPKDDGWSSGTISLFDRVNLTPESKSPLIQELLYPRVIPVFAESSGLEIAGWSDGSFVE